MNHLQRLKYAPFLAQLVIIRRCNLACTYCNEFDQISAPLATNLIKDRITKLKKLGVFGITLTGGEPLLHPDLEDLVRFCRYDQRFFRTTLITNGFLLTPEIIETLNKAGLQDMQISIDGVNPNNNTIKVLKSLKGKLELLAKHARFNVVVSGVVGACPAAESFEVIQYAKKKRLRPRILLIHDHTGQIKLSADQLQAYHTIKKMLPWHPYEISNWRDKMIKTGTAPFKCRAGSRYLYIDEFGMANWCSQTRKFFQKDLMTYTEADLKEQFYSYKFCQDKCTLGCVRSASAFDNWRGQKTS